MCKAINVSIPLISGLHTNGREMCTAIIKPHKYRHGGQCRMPEWKDGLCYKHHPDRAAYQPKRMTDEKVGTYLRKAHPEVFKVMCDEIELAHGAKLTKKRRYFRSASSKS